MFESTIPVDMRNTMKAEAVKCMGILKLDKRCIKEFEKGNVWLSSGPFGGLYEADDKLKNMIKDVETEHDIIVFHVVENMVHGMHCYSMLCVCKYPEEYEMDAEDLKDGYAFSYVLNVDAPDCSEFGTICVKSSVGGVSSSGQLNKSHQRLEGVKLSGFCFFCG